MAGEYQLLWDPSSTYNIRRSVAVSWGGTRFCTTTTLDIPHPRTQVLEDTGRGEAGTYITHRMNLHNTRRSVDPAASASAYISRGHSSLAKPSSPPASIRNRHRAWQISFSLYGTAHRARYFSSSQFACPLTCFCPYIPARLVQCRRTKAKRCVVSRSFLLRCTT